MFKGIDAYNTLVTLQTDICHNQFEGVHKGITLNSVPFARVVGNYFSLPLGTDTYDSYGIFGEKSFGFKITDNIMLAPPNANDYCKGLVINQSYIGDDSPSGAVLNNIFDGTFAAATQMEGENELRLDCNAYANLPQIDWYLSENATLNDQGVCFPEQAGPAFSSHWHDIATPIPMPYQGAMHIVNTSPNWFTLRHDYNSRPFAAPEPDPGTGYSDQDYAVYGLVDLQSCSALPTYVDASCTTAYEDHGGDGDISGMLDGDCTNNIADNVRLLLRNNQAEAALLLLQCVQKDWAYKVLAATYTDKREYALAIAQLGYISEQDPDNLAFIALYTALINQLMNGNDGSGKADAYAEALHQAETESNTNATIAQSLLALQTGKSYVRNSAKITRKQGSNLVAKAFSLAPNPTTGTLLVTVSRANAWENHVLRLYDLHGRLLMNHAFVGNTTSLQLNNLANGIYYVRFDQEAQAQKLVLIK